MKQRLQLTANNPQRTVNLQWECDTVFVSNPTGSLVLIRVGASDYPTIQNYDYIVPPVTNQSLPVVGRDFAVALANPAVLSTASSIIGGAARSAVVEFLKDEITPNLGSANYQSLALSDQVGGLANVSSGLPIKDNFGDGIINPSYWTASATNAPVPTESGGALRLTPTVGVIGEARVLSVGSIDLTLYDLIWEISASLVGTNEYAGPYAYLNSTNSYQFAFGAGNILFRKNIAGVNSDVSLADNRTTMRFCRFSYRASDDNVLWYTSPDGITWTLRRNALREIAITNLTYRMVAGIFALPQATIETLVIEHFEIRNPLLV